MLSTSDILDAGVRGVDGVFGVAGVCGICGGTNQEKTKYIKKKTSEMYRFKKLTGTEEERKAYRARENARVKKYQQRKKIQTSQEETSSDSSNSRKKEQDRLRYVPYVKYVKHTLTNF